MEVLIRTDGKASERLNVLSRLVGRASSTAVRREWVDQLTVGSIVSSSVSSVSVSFFVRGKAVNDNRRRPGNGQI